MRIAIYHNLHSGGAKRVVAEHIRRLAERHEVHVYCPSTADRSFAEGDENSQATTFTLGLEMQPYLSSPFGRLNPLVRLRNLHPLAQVHRQIARRILDDGNDVALVHPCQYTQAPLLLRELRALRLPSVYYCHELPRHLYEAHAQPKELRSALQMALDRVDPLPGFLRRQLVAVDKANALAADRILVNSAHVAGKVLAAYGVASDVCSPGVEFRNVPPRQQAAVPYVLSVGALAPHKGFGFVIETLAAIPAAARPQMVIVSNYQEASELARLQHLASASAVTLRCLCAVSEQELHELYSAAALFAYAPLEEPLGLVTLEASAHGLPIVAVGEGGVLETVVDGVTGLLVPRDAAAMGAAIQSVLEVPSLAARLGAAGKEYVQRMWSWERHMQRLEPLLAEVAACAGSDSFQVKAQSTGFPAGALQQL